MKAILINDDRSLRWDNVPDPLCALCTKGAGE